MFVQKCNGLVELNGYINNLYTKENSVMRKINAIIIDDLSLISKICSGDNLSISNLIKGQGIKDNDINDSSDEIKYNQHNCYSNGGNVN